MNFENVTSVYFFHSLEMPYYISNSMTLNLRGTLWLLGRIPVSCNSEWFLTSITITWLDAINLERASNLISEKRKRFFLDRNKANKAHFDEGQI